MKWLESLPWRVRWADTSYVVHAGIRPDRLITKQEKDHCIFIRRWNAETKKISNEGKDRWWYEYPYLYSSQRLHSAPSIKIFFGHQRHDKAWVSHWACALDGGVVFGGTFRTYEESKGILETDAKRDYELDEEKRASSSSVAV